MEGMEGGESVAGAAAAEKAKKGGRPGAPDFLALENLAVVRAATKARLRPGQTAGTLDAGTKEFYPAMLCDAAKVYGWPIVAWKQKNEGCGGIWEIEDSCALRPENTKLWESRYQKTLRPVARNVLTPALYKWYNCSDGQKPSGKKLDEAILFCKEALWDHVHKYGPTSVDLTKEAPAEPVETGEAVSSPTAAPTAAPTPASTAGGGGEEAEEELGLAAVVKRTRLRRWR